MDLVRIIARPAVLAGLVLAIAFAYFASYASYGNIIPDEAWLLDTSARVADGQVPHRDFDCIYTPARYYLFAAVFELTDGCLLAVRL